MLYEQLGYKQDNPSLYSKSLYSGATRNGSDSSRSSTITKTLNSDGSYKYKLSYTGTGSNSWSSIDFPVFTFTDGTTYHFVCKIRCNSSNIAFNLRAARCNNDYATSSVDVTTVKGYSGWITYHVQAVCNTTLSGTASTVGSPRLEFYTSNMSTSGTVYSFDIDIKDCQIYSNSDYQKIYDTEEDCSGFDNIGYCADVYKRSNDTPRYEGSTFISSGGVFGSRTFPDNIDGITCSAWVKSSNIASQSILGNWESGGCGIYTNSLKNAVFEYFDGSTYKTCIGTTTLSMIFGILLQVYLVIVIKSIYIC